MFKGRRLYGAMKKKENMGGKVVNKMEAIAIRKDNSLLEQQIDAQKAEDDRKKDNKEKRMKKSLRNLFFFLSLVILT